MNTVKKTATIIAIAIAASMTGCAQISELQAKATNLIQGDKYAAEISESNSQSASLREIGIDSKAKTRVAKVFDETTKPGEAPKSKNKAVLLAFGVTDTSRASELAIEAIADAGDGRWETKIVIRDTAVRAEQIERDFHAEIKRANLTITTVPLGSGEEAGIVLSHPHSELSFR